MQKRKLVIYLPDIGVLLGIKENEYFKLKCLSRKVRPAGEYIVIGGTLYQNGKRKAVKVSNAILENPSDFIVQPGLEV